MSKPFAGVKVLDFTRVLAGPYASYQLALLGADVIKVESREGDDMRYGNRANDWEKRGLAAPWIAVNAGKRSITLDLKKPKAIEAVKRLVAKADVVIENFRPGVMDQSRHRLRDAARSQSEADLLRRLGLRPGRPAGQDGGLRRHDPGDVRADVDHRLREQRADARGLCRRRRDVGRDGGLGVASALFQRTHTGKGQLVDVAMIDAVMGYLAQQFTEHLMTGRVHGQAANLSVTRKPTGNLFKTKDGWIVLAVMTDPQFQRLMKELGCADALADPRFVDWPTRIDEQHGAARDHRGSDEAARPRRPGRRALPRSDIPAGQVLSIPETVQLDLFQHRTVLQSVDTPHGPIRVVGSGFRLEHGGGSVERSPATLGRAHRRGAGRSRLLRRRDRRYARQARSSSCGWPAAEPAPPLERAERRPAALQAPPLICPGQPSIRRGPR